VKLTVRPIDEPAIYKDMVRIPEACRLDIDGNKIGEGKICKIAVPARASKLLAIRGPGRYPADLPEIHMDDKTRNDLGVELNKEYEFHTHSLSGIPNEIGPTQRFIVDLLTGEELVSSNDPGEFARREAGLWGPKKATGK
jgi:hypothetical protein